MKCGCSAVAEDNERFHIIRRSEDINACLELHFETSTAMRTMVCSWSSAVLRGRCSVTKFDSGNTTKRFFGHLLRPSGLRRAGPSAGAMLFEEKAWAALRTSAGAPLPDEFVGADGCRAARGPRKGWLECFRKKTRDLIEEFRSHRCRESGGPNPRRG